MKKFIYASILFFILFSLSVKAQQNFSLATKTFLNDLNSLKSNGEIRLNADFIEKYALWFENGQYYVSGLAKISDDNTIERLRDNACIVNTQIGHIISIRVPIKNVEKIGNISGLLYIELGRKVKPYLKDALIDTRADSVHQGIGLLQSYTGKGVIIGVTDWGFDYTHPTFYDTSLSHLRIAAAWDQYKLSGPAPANYTYGTLFSSESELLAAGSDTFNIYGYSTHGTHVAGIAAGSGAGTEHKGFAYESELVFVTIKVDEASVLDAFSFIYEYAANAGKPLVINMSWGLYYIGTLDGNSLISQAIDILSDLGCTFVSSAGNNGNVNYHIKKDFLNPNDSLRSFVSFEPYGAIPTMWGQSITMWGTPNTPYHYTAEIYDNTYNLIASLPLFSTDDAIMLDTNVIIGTDTVVFRIASEASNIFNQRAGVRLRVRNLNTSGYRIAVKVVADTGTVHLWNVIELVNDVGNWGAPFTNPIAGTTAGDANYSIGEPACTKSVISVGAYRSQIELPNGNTAFGNIANFSSKGPLIDGTIKPDITAPGVSVASAMSSFYGSSYSSVATVDFNGKPYKFARLSGTSMSGPAVAGIAALLLEINPTLSPDALKNIIKQTARQDEFTGHLPLTGDVLWGWGKINAYHAARITGGLSNTYDNLSKTYTFNLYPNPSTGNIFVESSLTIENITIYDISGREVFNKSEHVTYLDLNFLKKGMYFLVANTINLSLHKTIIIL